MTQHDYFHDAVECFGPPDDNANPNLFCEGSVQRYPETGKVFAIIEVDGKRSGFFGPLEWFEKLIKKNGGGDALTALAKHSREENAATEAEDEAKARAEASNSFGFCFMQDCLAKGMNYEQARAAFLADKADYKIPIGEWTLKRAWKNAIRFKPLADDNIAQKKLNDGEPASEVTPREKTKISLAASHAAPALKLAAEEEEKTSPEEITQTARPQLTVLPGGKDVAPVDDLPQPDLPATWRDITALRLQLRRNGFHPIPVEGKKPVLKGWQQKFDVSEEEIRRWEKTYPRARNTGVIAKPTPGLDIDIMHEAAAEAIEALAREFFEEHGNIHVRFGLPPKRLIPLRTDEPFPKLSRVFSEPKGPDGKEPKIEILCDGQHYVVDGIHPDTGKPYSWSGGELAAIQREELPYVRREDMERFLDAAVKLLVEKFGFVLARTSKTVDSSEQLNLTPKNGDGKPAPTPLDPTSALDNFTSVPEFADLPDESLSEGLPDKKWFDLLSPDQKDAALDHGLECIAKNSTLLKFGNNENWYRLAMSVARSGAPHLDAIFIKHARTVPGADSEEELRKKLAYCKKNPRGITVGTFIHWAKQCGANFEPWLRDERQRPQLEPIKIDWAKVKQPGWLKSVADLPTDIPPQLRHIIRHTGNLDDLNNDLIKSQHLTKPYRSWIDVTRAVVALLKSYGRYTMEEVAEALSADLPCNQHITKQKDKKRAIEEAILQSPAAFRDRDKYGNPKPSLANAVIAIQALGIVVRYDLFHHRIRVTYKGQSKTIHEGLLTDNTISAIRSLINNTYRLDCGDPNTFAAVREIAWKNAYDPVLDMLNDCQSKWDGVKRLDTWVSVYLGGENTPLNRAFGRLALIAACRRARQPGCKFDIITVLEGPEGTNKSTAIKILAGDDENFSDQSILGATDKEVQEQLDGIWMHENADLAGMVRAEVEKVKAFASRQFDRARPAFGRVREDRSRRSTEWGTTNSDAYLLSQTGNRRFAPLKTGKIDLQALMRDRDQLIGEAATYEAAGESITLDESLWGDAREAQEQRRVTDPWEDILANIPDQVDVSESNQTTHFITIIHRSTDGYERVASADLLTYVLNVPKAQQSSFHSQRLAHAMKFLGWTRNPSGRVTINDTPVRGYIRKENEIPPGGGADRLTDPDALH
jgi:predicted P-loop ATPase